MKTPWSPVRLRPDMETLWSRLLELAVAVLLVLAASLPAVAAAVEAGGGPGDVAAQRQRLHDAFHQGNFRDAYDGLRKLLLDPQVAPSGDDLSDAVQALVRLNRVSEIDELLESAVKVHQGLPGQWTLLWDVAGQYIQVQHQGTIIAGKFVRGPHRGGDGRFVNSLARDRVRALQLMVQALAGRPAGRRSPKGGPLPAGPGRHMADGPPGRVESWRLQAKTDLGVLPDYEEGWGYFYGGQTRGAPVDDDGQPVFYAVPKSFEAAQLRRRALAVVPRSRRSSSTPPAPTRCRWKLADFLWQQFGVQTMASYGWRFGREAIDDSQGGSRRHLRPGHAGRGRDDRPAGHRREAVQAARRVQLHRHLPADCRRAENRPRRRGAGAAGADLREPPAVSQGGRLLAAAA